MSDKRIVSLVLNAEKDADIIKWLDSQEGSKSEAIRAAIRARIGTGSISLGDVYQAIREIDRKLAHGVILAGSESGDAGDLPDEPPDIAAALDNLGL